jgi:hypothetical protein
MMKSKIPKSYRNVETCLHCKHVFAHQEWGEKDHLYCTWNAPSRPKCGSAKMINEGFRASLYDSNIYKDDKKRWDRWSSGRSVQRTGICNEFETRGDK